MSFLVLLHLINLFFAGILAGMEIVIHYGLRSPAEVLSDSAQLRLRQALILKLRVLVPAVFLPMALSGVSISVLDRESPGTAFRYVGLLALGVWILIRIVGTVPINSATLGWDSAAPPNDWKARVTRAERFHDVGAWAVVISFACFLANWVEIFRP
jgi:hypothetical protein